MNPSYLPSKKILIFIGVILIVAGGIYLLTNDRVRSGSLTSQNNGVEDLERLDTDNDGLEDWEEALWNTDPKNPDTDNDGIGDGEEVESGTHPKIAGPNDGLDQRRIDAVYSQDAEVPENKTRDTWQELLPYMAAYLSVDDGEKEISMEGIDNISTEVSQQIEEESNQVNYYEVDDLSIEDELTSKNIGDYFTEVTQITASYYNNTEIEDELLIFAQATAGDTIDAEQLVGLEVIATDYRSLARDLVEIAVPKTLSLTYLDMVNNYLDLAQATENMAALETDPIRSMVGLKRYRDLINQQQEIATTLGRKIGQESRRLLESSQ